MSLIKRVTVLFSIVVLSLTCMVFTGCGEEIAATWSGGQITEETVTNTIENLRSYYGIESDEDWATFVKERTYEEQSETAMTATETAIANISSDEEDSKPEGTIEDLRAYIIEQIIRSQIIENEIKSRNITIDESDVDLYVEQQRSYVESKLMPGVFESYLQRQGYANLEAYKEDVREQLKQLKLQQEVSTISTDDGSEISGKSAWNIWFDEMYEKANVKINPAPDSLPYAIVEITTE